MNDSKTISATLLLQDGTIFSGIFFGAEGLAFGEVVFNTSMTGYQEMLTDCSYTGQILTLSYPHIGNTGINFEDNESLRIWAQGLIVREYSEFYSNWRAQKSLSAFLKEQNIVAITNIDTRALIHFLRDKGSMMGCIIPEKLEKNSSNYYQALSQLKKYINGKPMEKDFTNEVCVKSIQNWNQKDDTSSNQASHLILYDFGFKHNIVNSFLALGCKVSVVPAHTSHSELLKIHPQINGIILSNGPGDPNAFKDTIQLVSELIQTNLPILGICLGHQLLALGFGAKVTKMKFGHHGTNHPVLNIKTGQVMITSQNHGFTVQDDTLPMNLEVTHRSLFDNTLQGFQHKTKPILGFQGHPEASPGPKESIEIFELFLHFVTKSIKSSQHYVKQVAENASFY